MNIVNIWHHKFFYNRALKFYRVAMSECPWVYLALLVPWKTFTSKNENYPELKYTSHISTPEGPLPCKILTVWIYLYESTVSAGLHQGSICPWTGTKFSWKKCTMFMPSCTCQVSEFWNNITLTPEMLSILLSPALQHKQYNARSICVYDRKHHVTPQFSSSLLQDEAI